MQEPINLMESVFPNRIELKEILDGSVRGNKGMRAELQDVRSEIFTAEEGLRISTAAIRREEKSLKKTTDPDQRHELIQSIAKNKEIVIQLKEKLPKLKQARGRLVSDIDFYQSFLDISTQYDATQDEKVKQDLLMKKAEMLINQYYKKDPDNEVNKAAMEALKQAQIDLKGAKTKDQKRAIVMNMVAIVAALGGDDKKYEALHDAAKKLSGPDDALDITAARESAVRWERTTKILCRVVLALAVGAAIACMIICPPAAVGALIALVTPFAIQAAAIAVSATSVFLANMAGNVVIALAALFAVKVHGMMKGNDTPLKDFFKGIAHGVASVLKLPYTAVNFIVNPEVSEKKTQELVDTVESKMGSKSVATKTETFKAALQDAKKTSTPAATGEGTSLSDTDQDAQRQSRPRANA